MEHYFKHYLQPLLQYFHQHPHIGGLFAFVVAMSESLPLIGTIIPGSVTMTAIGTLIGSAILPGFTTIVWASLGAFTGDCIGFWLGYRYNENIRNIWPFKRYPKMLAMGEDFFHKHGGKSILIGRFIGPARSTMPMVAGILRMSWPRFIAAAIPSAILWALLYMTPGIMLGALSLELPPGKATEFVLVGILIIIALWFIFWLIQYFFRSLARWINKKVDALWDWLYRHHSSKFFISGITNHQNSEDHHQLTMSLLALLSAGLFSIIYLNVIFHTFLTHLNEPLFYFLQSIHNVGVTHFFMVFTLVFNPKLSLVIGTLLVAALLITKQWRAATHFALVFVVAATIGLACKHLYYSPRPAGLMVFNPSSSFPSGHTLMCMVITGYIAFLFTRVTQYKWHWISYTVAGVIMLCCGLSRMYLGAHWLTDVIGSYFLGFAVLLAGGVSYRRLPKTHSDFSLKPWVWGLMVSIAFTVPGLVFAHLQWKKLSYNIQPYSINYNIRVDQWWNQPQDFLPLYRHNRFGKPIQPFNIQWTAPLNRIKQTLTQNSWKVITKQPKVKSALTRFISHNPKYHLPILPWQYLNRKPVLLMIKPTGNKGSIIELRLWATHVNFTDSKKSLWIGAINLHKPPKRLISLRHSDIIRSAPSKVIKKIKQNLTSYRIKIMRVSTADQPKHIQASDWNGTVLLIR